MRKCGARGHSVNATQFHQMVSPSTSPSTEDKGTLLTTERKADCFMSPVHLSWIQHFLEPFVMVCTMTKCMLSFPSSPYFGLFVECMTFYYKQTPLGGLITGVHFSLFSQSQQSDVIHTEKWKSVLETLSSPPPITRLLYSAWLFKESCRGLWTLVGRSNGFVCLSAMTFQLSSI